MPKSKRGKKVAKEEPADATVPESEPVVAPEAPAKGKKGKSKRKAAQAPEPASAPAPEPAPAPAAAKGKKRRRRGSSMDVPPAAEVGEVEGLEDEPAAGAGGAVAPVVARMGYTATVPYTNKQRVLIFCTRGVTARYRHLMDDLRVMIPHHKKEVKLDTKDFLNVINEIAEVKSCNSCLFFEVRKKKDLFLWMSKTPLGPSVKFHVLNVHTMNELRLTGNCLKGSRPFLSFDATFERHAHLKLLKEMFVQVFNIPRGHPKSQPFHDHVVSFHIVDNKIWFRHYQVVDDAMDEKSIKKAMALGEEPTSLVEIGPRFVMDIVRVFQGSFGGQTIFENPDYVSPNKLRHELNAARGARYTNRVEAVTERKVRAATAAAEVPADPVARVFKDEE